jgi:DNA-binding NarL/FixJ family response regulator
MVPMMRVVLVEDFGPFRRMLQAELADRAPGCEVAGEAATGEMGVEVVAALRPDVVVMDFRLPGIDGGEATRRILEHDPRVTVIGFVGARSDGEALLHAGAEDVFYKEDLDHLVDHLRVRSSATS